MGNLIEVINDKILNLPKINNVALKLNKLLMDEYYDVGEVEKLISLDPVVSAMVLRLANSILYNNSSKKIESIKNAILKVGSKNIKDFILFDSLKTTFNSDLNGYGISSEMFWKYNIMVANIAKEIALKKMMDENLAYTAGLLHDIGKIIISEYLKNEILEINEKFAFEQQEKAVLGITHADVGAMMLLKWNMGDNLVECVKYHHCPNESKNNNLLVDIIHIASLSAMSIGFGVGVDGTNYEFENDSLIRLDLTINDVQIILSDVVEKTLKFLKNVGLED